jgi:putative ABC transport system permease protein
MPSLFADLRFAFRSLRRAPFFSTLVVLTLMIGIGATSAVFSVIYPVLLAKPPYPEADRLVMVWEKTPAGEKEQTGWLTGQDIRRETKSLASLAMVSYWLPIARAGDDARQLNGLRVSHTYFRTLGVRPWLGRDFAPEEDLQATRQVVMLSYPLWRSLYGGDSAVVGGKTEINGVTYLIAGVMPEDFRDLLSPQAEIWAPLGYEAQLAWACRTCHHLRATYARLKDGVSLAAATHEIDNVLRTLKGRHPDQYGTVGALLPTLQADVSGGVRPPLLGLFAAVLLLLLLACANVGNLFLGRTGERETDLVIRLALGAERGRLVRLVSFEAALLALLGGRLAVAAWAGTRALLLTERGAGSSPAVELALPVLAPSAHCAERLDGRRLPALLALGESTLADLPPGRPHRVRTGAASLRNAVVVAEVALAVLLLAGASLQVRSLQRALAVQTGFEPAGVVTLGISLVGPRYDSAGSTRVYYRRLLEETAACRA